MATQKMGATKEYGRTIFFHFDCAAILRNRLTTFIIDMTLLRHFSYECKALYQVSKKYGIITHISCYNLILAEELSHF